MNLISNIETSSTSAWNQTSNDPTSNQWLIQSSTNQPQSGNSSQQQQITTNQSTSDLDANSSSSLMNETHLPKNWSHIVDPNAGSTVNQSSPTPQLDSPTQSVDYSSSTNDPLLKTSIKDDKFTNIELCSDNWGSVPINQNTQWEIPQSQQSNYQQSPREVHSCNGLIDNSWKYASSTTGTDIWEANVRKKSNDQSPTGDLSQNKNAQNWNSTNAVQMANHIGGTWGEDDSSTTTANPLNNNNWMNDKQQWNDNDDKLVQMSKGMNDTLFSTWNSNSNSTKEVTWTETDSNSGLMNENLVDDNLGTAMWKRQNGNQNTRWKDQSNDLYKQMNNKLTMNNNTNLNNINLMNNQTCANNLNAPMQNGFSTASPGVLRIPSANSMTNQNKLDQWNKVQTMQPNNPMNKQWFDQSSNLNNNINGQQPNGMFWNDQPANNNAQLNWNKSNMNNNDDWNSKLKKEIIMQSHQFRVLADKGFRKENIEAALRNSNMNLKDAIDELRADVLKENCNDLDKRKNSFNHPSSLPPNSSISNRNTSQFNNQMSQPNQMFRNSNNNLNNTKTPNTANAMLQDKRLGNLVQQIQLAVQSGHLNAQILNQPLSVNTIQLIYQLLQQIKNLQTLQLQSTPNMNKNIGPTSQSDLNVQITMIKQRISNLQNQIKLQQAVFINNNQQQQTNQSVPNSDLNGLNSLNNINNLNNGLSINPATMSDFNKLISPDSPNEDFRDALQSNNNNNQQSRLSTWKNSPTATDGFSRAPGSIKAGSSNTNQQTNNWPTGSFGDDAWLNDTNELTNALSNMNVQQQQQQPPQQPQSQQTFSITDSVPEFEPGKPWKGSAQMKSSDDDPHLTPGSVNRSILSLNNFNNWSTTKNNLQTTATTTPAISNASTWSFNNGPALNNNSTSPNWNGFNSNESSTSPVENLWQNNNKIKGPPPGLSPNKDNKMKNNFSSYLLIKNLTPQIDASTLRTLCLQHGPLQMFNLLNNVALVKYKSREEAMKAQAALNNCFLSNTTILVDLIAENEVQHYLSGQPSSNNSLNSWNNSSANSQPNLVSNGAYRGQSIINSNNSNPWRNSNQMTTESQWQFNGSNLWNNSMDAGTMPINNLLPGDLLNGESA